MSVVPLVSGGLDSTLMSLLADEEGLAQYPLFIDYGQRSAAIEWRVCRKLLSENGLPRPRRMRLQGFGQLVPSGLTWQSRRLNEDAFLPGRNTLFLLAGTAYAYGLNADAVTIGLLSEESHLFPDQTAAYLERAEAFLSVAVGRRIALVAPLMHLTKADVLDMVRAKGLKGTYSCHSGRRRPCGRCVSCIEIKRSRGGA
jgi:7-cyano-7-deazaguanine synthase